MYVSICMCLCICICKCKCRCKCININIHAYACMYLYIYIYTWDNPTDWGLTRLMNHILSGMILQVCYKHLSDGFPEHPKVGW